jgi:hypothetical protein
LTRQAQCCTLGRTMTELLSRFDCRPHAESNSYFGPDGLLRRHGRTLAGTDGVTPIMALFRGWNVQIYLVHSNPEWRCSADVVTERCPP